MSKRTRWARLPWLAATVGFAAALSIGARRAVATLDHVAPAAAGTVAGSSSSAALDDIMARGPYLGFDTNIYPGDDAMRSWREHATYHWVGYYLPAPCHKDGSWQGKRETLDAMGWGVAVVYVGQQTWGRTPRRNGPVPRGATCNANLVNAERGRLDADDAIARAAAEGFAEGTAIFLDIEYMKVVPDAMRDYYVAWTERMLDDGRYRPAYYAHTKNAPLIYADVRALVNSRGLEGNPPFWIAGGRDFAPDRSPADVGHDFAAVWQGKLDTWEEYDTVRLPIDVNVAAVPSPSSAVYTAD